MTVAGFDTPVLKEAKALLRVTVVVYGSGSPPT
jgi:hypothetical protein